MRVPGGARSRSRLWAPGIPWARRPGTPRRGRFADDAAGPADADDTARTSDPARMSDDEAWDVVVVGAGPAGSAAALGALRADPRLRVLLLDRADFPRDKSCGDGIAPHVVDALRSVGAADVVDGWAPLRRLDAGARRRGGRPHDGARRSGSSRARCFDARLVGHATGGGGGAAPAPGPLARRPRRTASSPTARCAGRCGRRGRRALGGPPGGSGCLRRAGGRSRSAATRRRRRRRRGEQVHRVRRPPPAVVRLGLRPRRRADQRRVRRAAPGPPARRRRAACCSTQLERLVPGAAATGDDWRGHHLPLSQLAVASSPTGRCCSPATPPGWSTR